MMTAQRFLELIQAYKQGNLEQQSWNELRFALQAGEHKDLLEEDIAMVFDRFETHASWTAATEAMIWDKVQEQTLAEMEESVKVIPLYRRLWIRYAAAAVFLFAISGTYLFVFHSKKTNPSPVAYKGDVAPGHTGATLHLSDGRTIVLDSAANGNIAMQGKLQVVKENGELKYVGKADEVVYNDITTDKGRQWQLVLPDGSKVWLNSASSIHYPLAFTGRERVVEITGEAYFEVVHNEKQPFKVKAGSQTIEDIGTGFNVNAYGDESAIRTTLLEGIVKVNGKVLIPGEQYANGVIAKVNTEEAVAWKNGFFAVHDADIQTVMRQLARWYNVTVSYEGDIKVQRFTGKIDHNLTLSQLLDGLSGSRVHFRIEQGKHIVIIP